MVEIVPFQIKRKIILTFSHAKKGAFFYDRSLYSAYSLIKYIHKPVANPILP
jgi:hypothetical protein